MQKNIIKQALWLLLLLGISSGVFAGGNNRSKAKYRTAAGATDIKAIKDSALALLDAVEEAGNWMDKISADALVKGNFGIKTKKDGNEYQVAFSQLSFQKGGGVARVFARAILPLLDENDENRQLLFAGYVALSRTGGIVDGGKLALLGEDTLSTCDQWYMLLHGDGKSGTVSDNTTSLSFDCSGYTGLWLNGHVELSKAFYVPAASAGEMSASGGAAINAAFKGAATSLNDLMLTNLKFNRPFALKKVKNYTFLIDSATLDFSDKENPLIDDEHQEDFEGHLEDLYKDSKEDELIWRGLYVRKLKVSLPREFRPKGAKDSVELECEFAMLDDDGFATVVNKSHVVKIDQGKAGSWAMSIEKLFLEISESEISAGGLAGSLILPLQDKKKVMEKIKAKEAAAEAADAKAAATAKTAAAAPAPAAKPAVAKTETAAAAKDSTEAEPDQDEITFEGQISKDGEYEIKAAFSRSIIAPIWKSKLEIDTSSYIEIKVDDDGFHAKAVLSGKLTFNSSGDSTEAVAAADSTKKKVFACKGIEFEELTLQTEKPYLSVKALGVAGALNIASFEAEYSVGYTSEKPKEWTRLSDEVAGLKIAADIKLMDGKIGGKADLAFYGRYDEAAGEWKYYDYKLSEIGIKADFGKAAFEGSLTIMRNDPTFGDGFAGSLKLRVNKFEVAASGIFGTKNNTAGQPFRYWSVDGQVSGLKLVTGAMVFTGFSGGASYMMNQATNTSGKMPSGITYIPDEKAFLRVRAGVLFNVTSEEAMTATAGLEIVFNKNWGVNTAIIKGTAKIMSASSQTDPKAALKEGLAGTVSDSAANASSQQKYDNAIWAKLTVTLDLVNDVYSGNLDAFINYKEQTVGGLPNYRAGTASFYISASKWYINVGTTTEPVMVNLNQSPVYATGTAYFMMGNNIQAGGATGFGVKHGMSFTAEVGYDAGWLFARVGGGLKYDIMLFKNNNFYCNGAPAGLNGWYGSARMTAWLYAAVGVRFWSVEFNVLNANIYADMEIRGPKPLYFYGVVNGYYNVGWGWFSKSGSFSVDVKKGTYCAF